MAENTANPNDKDPQDNNPQGDDKGGQTVYNADDDQKNKDSDQEQKSDALSEEQANKLREDITKDVEGKVSEQVSKSVIQKIGEALGLTKKEEDSLPTDKETLQKIIDAKVSEKFEHLSKESEQQEKYEEQARQQKTQEIVRSWHRQYNDLARLGKVPVIKNPTDQNDPGVVARRKIIMGIGKLIDEQKQSDPTNSYTPSISDVLLRAPDILKAPPGADLPISGDTSVRENQDSFSYKDIHSKSFQEIIDSEN